MAVVGEAEADSLFRKLSLRGRQYQFAKEKSDEFHKNIFFKKKNIQNKKMFAYVITSTYCVSVSANFQANGK